jgi:hypothetical protein
MQGKGLYILTFVIPDKCVSFRPPFWGVGVSAGTVEEIVKTPAGRGVVGRR